MFETLPVEDGALEGYTNPRSEDRDLPLTPVGQECENRMATSFGLSRQFRSPAGHRVRSAAWAPRCRMAGGSLADLNYWRCAWSNASHAARCVARHGVRSDAVPVALVGECSIPSGVQRGQSATTNSDIAASLLGPALGMKTPRPELHRGAAEQERRAAPRPGALERTRPDRRTPRPGLRRAALV